MLLFFYGSLKRGYWNCRHYMTDERYLKDAETVRGFRLFEHATGGYPLLVRQEEDGYAVLGELWEVSEPTVARLDDMEGAAGYARQEVRLTDGTVAQTYIFLHDVPSHFKECGRMWAPTSRCNAAHEGSG